jgi:hypothetical protein
MRFLTQRRRGAEVFWRERCSGLFNHREHREHRGFWRAWMRFFNAETQRRRGFLEGAALWALPGLRDLRVVAA